MLKLAIAQSDREAVISILAKHARAWIDHSRKEKEKAALDAEMASLTKVLADCLAGLRVFGLDTSKDGVWDFIRTELTQEVGKRIGVEFDDPEPSPDHSKSDVPSTSNMLQMSVAPVPPPVPKIWKLVRDRLQVAGDAGTKAGPIREYVEKTYAVRIHEKTVGMSLYRLLKKGMARRDGHTWYFVPQATETKNPGTAAPGSIEDLLS